MAGALTAQRLPLQFAEAQSFPIEHACPFANLHAPVASHVFAPLQVAPVVSSALVTVMPHVPSEPQFRHWGQLDWVQHTPSRQLPKAHSDPTPQP
jgi:hypothetical protein